MESILIVAAIILAGAGAFSAWLGWNKSGEPFDARKFANGVVTGIFAGIGLVIANAVGIVSIQDQTQAFILIGSLVFTVVGIDQLRVTTAGAISNRAVEKVENEIVGEDTNV